MKRYEKAQIPSVELEKGVCGRPFLPLGNRDFVEFTIEIQGMIKALPGSALEDALQLDVAGSVALAKGLQGFLGILDGSFVQVCSKLCAISIRAE
jgi:hypothetical protein